MPTIRSARCPICGATGQHDLDKGELQPYGWCWKPTNNLLDPNERGLVCNTCAGIDGDPLLDDTLLVPVPKWDRKETNPLYIQIRDKQQLVKVLCHPEIVPIKIITGNEIPKLTIDQWLGKYHPDIPTQPPPLQLQGFLAKDPDDVKIGLIKIESVPNEFNRLAGTFKQAFGIELPDQPFAYNYYAGYPGNARPSYSRLWQKIKDTQGWLALTHNVNYVENETELYLEISIRVEGLGLKDCPPVTFRFPGDGQQSEFDKAHKYCELLVERKKEMANQARGTRLGNPRQQEPPARRGRHLW